MTVGRDMKWLLHVDARTEQAARKLAHRVRARLDERLEVERIEPYPKTGGNVVHGRVALAATELPEAVMEVLALATGLVGRWDVDCPEETANGWHFDGFAVGGFTVPGVVMAQWMLSPVASSAEVG